MQDNNPRDMMHSDYQGLFKEGESLGAQVAEYFRSLGLEVKYTPNKSGHVQVIGKERKVNFYATTGTIHANPVKGKFKEYKLRGASNKRGLERVVSLANHGY